MKNIVIEIQRWSVSDGPGTRTVVFLKGCPLHCPWCANPESQDRQPQIGIFPSRCVECHACARECPEEVAIPAKEGAFSANRCIQCGKCIEVCHSDARAWLGEEMSAGQLIQIIKKDMVFYRKSSGGVTFSGGEPLTQPASSLVYHESIIKLHLNDIGYPSMSINLIIKVNDCDIKRCHERATGSKF